MQPSHLQTAEPAKQQQLVMPANVRLKWFLKKKVLDILQTLANSGKNSNAY